MPARPKSIQEAARELLDAMDRQHGNALFSPNVQDARAALRHLLPVTRDERDRSRAA